MSVDLHRIGTGISSGSSRNGFGNIVSFPSAAGFPANGSYNSTLNDVEYPIAEGGASVTVNSVDYPSQTCDVDVENDGAGGTYTDWTTATDVQYKPYGTILSTGSEPMSSSFTYAESPNTNGSFTWGSFPAYNRADGAGGSYLDLTTGYSLGTETATFNQVMDDTVAQSDYRIIYKGGSGFTDPAAGTWSECHRAGTTGSGTSGNLELYISELTTTYQSGTYYTIEMYDGVCGVYNITVNTYYGYGTSITSVYAYYDSENLVDVYAYYYWDGAGGFYVTYA